MSMAQPGAAAWRWQWSWLWRSPLLWALWIGTLVAAVVGERIRRVIVTAESTRGELADALAGFAAESVAVAIAAGRIALADAASASLPWPTGPAAGAVVRADRQGRELLLRVALGDDRERQFRCELLPGGAPRAFGVPFTAVAGRAPLPATSPPCLVARAELPELCPAVLERAARLPLPAAIARDAAIALLHLPAGTEWDDYRLGSGPGGSRIDVPAGGVLVVPGHLWVDRGPAPLQLQLTDDLTLVVHGNAYFGRSVRVTGRGRLLVVTVPGLAARSPLEGHGDAFLGLPGRRGPIELEFGLVVGGELNIAAERVRVDGPLVLHHGVTRTGVAPGDLVATGQRLPNPDRERVPGFRTSGSPRPGRLEPVVANTASSPAGRSLIVSQQPLYEPAPAR